MSQASFNIPNQPGASFRADVNAALQSLATSSAGPSAPGNPTANMFWADTANQVLKIRDTTNAAWITLCALDEFVHAGVPQNSRSENYVLTLDDANRHIFHPGSDPTPRVFTIPSNSAAPFPVGTIIGFVNDSGGAVTIGITSDTLVWPPTGATGSRTLSSCGIASIMKVTATKWMITGTGVS
ncbi:hypothetical protein SIID45300_02384 [Candidatus Magnetaquicoccaceae bacterium FCR-1]|uniref:Uncharacterized protein n=1 Tax=Candidatus Magnetaquiglobus chichijimensis TaxID=3141448 RepID=A0ABQ0CAZ4_9PROT